MSDRRNILQISTADVRGGAENVARNLQREYRARGHRSQMAVGFKITDDPDVFVIPNESERTGWENFWLEASGKLTRNGMRGVRRAARLAGILGQPGRQFNQWMGIEDFHFAGTKRIVELADQPDIVHCHNLHGEYFDLHALEWLSARVPVVITMHDAWLLSGHCVHSLGCGRWETGCGKCPDLTLYPAIRRDATAHNWKRKRSIYRSSRLHVATPCRWLMDKVERSILSEGASTMCDPGWHEVWRFTPEGLGALVGKSFGTDGIDVRAYGNSLTAAGELRGLVAEEFSKATLAYSDPRFALEVCIRARKSLPVAPTGSSAL